MGGQYVNSAAAYLISTAFGIYIMMLMLRFLLQSVRADFYNPVSQFLVRATNPVLVPVRRIVPGLGGIDLAAIALMLVLQLVELGLLLVVQNTSAPLVSLLVLAVAMLLKLSIYVFIVTTLIQVVMSWMSPGAYNPMTGLLHSLNEPLLGRVRRLVPPFSGLDLSPLIVLVVAQLALMLLVAPLRDLACIDLYVSQSGDAIASLTGRLPLLACR